MGKKRKEQEPISAVRCVSHLLREGVPDGPTDGPTDGWTYGRTYGQTDKPSYRDAKTHLKRGRKKKKGTDKSQCENNPSLRSSVSPLRTMVNMIIQGLQSQMTYSIALLLLNGECH